MLSDAKDQNFQRSTYPRSSPFTSSCLIPGGKYVLTGPAGWREISCKDKRASLRFFFSIQNHALRKGTGLGDNERHRWQELAALQGVGHESWYRYDMGSASSSLMRDMIGNASGPYFQSGSP